MKRLLLFNLATDSDDPVLGFTSAWINAFAQQTEAVYVITMRAGRIDLPQNVRVSSVGKERGYGELHRAAQFYRQLWRVLRTQRIDACFSHMIPVFSVLAAPLLRLYRVPLVTWYAHPQLSVTLKLAHYASDHMVSSLSGAYPYRRDKLSVIGQGIDTELFTPDSGAADEPPIILCAGRLSPVKDHPTLLRAVALLRAQVQRPFRVVIVGQPLGSDAAQYVAQLHQLVDRWRLGDVVSFAPAVPGHALAQWYRRCTVHVNLTPAGFGDKVAWEAMSCARVCVAANSGFRDTMGQYADALLFRPGDAGHLAERLGWALAISDAERAEIGGYLRAQVIALHSLSGLPGRLAAVFASIPPRGKQCE